MINAQKYPFDLYPRCTPTGPSGMVDGRLGGNRWWHSQLGLHMGQAGHDLMYTVDYLTAADQQHLGPVALGLICWWLQAPTEYLFTGEAASHAYCTGSEVGQFSLPQQHLTLTLYASKRGRWVVGTYDQGAASPADTWVVAAEA
jgi:hypothetical protein